MVYIRMIIKFISSRIEITSNLNNYIKFVKNKPFYNRILKILTIRIKNNA